MEEEKVQRVSSMENLPLEITQKILSGFPMVPQLQCRAVCTTWRSLLPKPKMVLIYGVPHRMAGTGIRMQSKIYGAPKSYYEVSKFVNIIRRYETTCKIEVKFYSSELNHVDDDDEQISCFGTLQKLDRSLIMPPSSKFRYNDRETFIVGSCNGLVCYAGYPDTLSLLLSLSRERNVYICNPLTGEQIQAPSDNWSGNTHTELAIGFGYSHSSDVYKVIRILRNYCCMNHRRRTVHVHSLKAGTRAWRSKSSVIEKTFVFHWNGVPLVGVFACGDLHWIDDKHSKKPTVVAFDLEHENFQLLPPIPSVGRDRQARVMELGGNLCVLEVAPRTHIIIWESSKYTHKRGTCVFPWVVKFRIAWEDYSWFEPFANTKTDQSLLSHNAILSCYDPATKTLRNLDGTLKKLMDRYTPSVYTTIRATPYVNSLVSLGIDYGGKTWVIEALEESYCY